LNKLEEKIEMFYNLCRQKRLKITPQRVEVFKMLVTSEEHPSAEAVYKKVKKVLPNVSLDTVNRTLNTLSKIGVAFVVEGSGDVKRFDGNLDNHQHFKCIKCKRVFDFRCKGLEKVELPESLEQDFKILKTTIYVEGLCKQCSGKRNI
jgi:Fur family peroxide stress response transcriptional regulator